MMEQKETTATEKFPLDEAQLRRLVRATLQTATRPEPGRLSALTPPPPARSPWTMWQRQAATLAVCLLLMIGGFGVYFTRPAATLTPLPAHLAATATDTPTTTLAAWDPEPVTTRETAVPATDPAPETPPTIGATPAPNPTPIAAADALFLTN
jgi:hypothetical protein